LNYFVRLIEDLFFIADIAEPGYRGAIEAVDIAMLLSTEVQARQLAQPHISWRLIRETPELILHGDAHLLLRLLRNTLDNAAKYANSTIEISAYRDKDKIEIVVADDGPGMSAKAIDEFGERKKHRVREGSEPLNVSLGLGSVIIKTIVDLHGGELRIQSGTPDANIARGTRFIFSFAEKDA
jgi:K+-sensing histidine kinase KdpD